MLKSSLWCLPPGVADTDSAVQAFKGDHVTLPSPITSHNGVTDRSRIYARCDTSFRIRVSIFKFQAGWPLHNSAWQSRTEVSLHNYHVVPLLTGRAGENIYNTCKCHTRKILMHSCQEPTTTNGYRGPCSVHLLLHLLLVRCSALFQDMGRYGQVGCHGSNSSEDAADPEIPAPGSILSSKTGEDDADEESSWRTPAVDREDQILPWSRTVDTPQNHNTGWKKGSWTQSLKSSTKVEHDLIGGEPSNQTPDDEPCHTCDVNRVSAIHISQTAEYQEE